MSTPDQNDLQHVREMAPDETPEGLTPHTVEVTEESLKEARASEVAAKTAAVLFAFVSIFTALLSGAYLSSKPAIDASAAAETLAKIEEVLPATAYNNPLLNDVLVLPATAQLGQSSESKIYRARLNGQPSALVAEAIAPDGYAGKIRMILAIDKEGKLLGMRVVEHKETPGLGDYIDPRKDKRRDDPWIHQFTNLSLNDLSDSEWKVRKEGGRFEYRAGATVTPRAVVKAVHKAEVFVRENWHTLFSDVAVKGQ